MTITILRFLRFSTISSTFLFIRSAIVGTLTINNKQWIFTDGLGCVWCRSAKRPRQDCFLGAWQEGTTRPMFLVSLLSGVEIPGESLLQVAGVLFPIILVEDKGLLSNELPDCFLQVVVGVYDHHWPRPRVLGFNQPLLV